MSDGTRPRSSLFTGILLIFLGVLFLIDRYDPAFGLGHLIRLYWPLLIILWGVVRLIEHLAARNAGQRSGPFLSGSEAALIVLLVIVLAGFAFRDWFRSRYPDIPFEMFVAGHFHQTRSLTSQTIPPGAHITVDTEHGDISIRGTDSNELTGSAEESAAAPSQSAADELLKSVDIAVEQTGNTYHVHPLRQDSVRGRVSVSIDIAVPKTASIEVSTGHGDISLTGMQGSVTVRSGSGDVDIRDAGSDVTADVQRGDVQISRVAGSLKLTGRGDDVDIAEVTGDAALEGPFTGNIRARSVGKTLHYASPWGEVTIGRLNGQMQADSHDVQIADAAGPLKIAAHNKDIDVRNIGGRIEVVNTHGDIKVEYSSPPREDLSLTNDSGDVELALPAASSFRISAVSRSGEVESDFGNLSSTATNGEDQGALSGQFGSGGPAITIVTSYGTIHLRKSR